MPNPIPFSFVLPHPIPLPGEKSYAIASTFSKIKAVSFNDALEQFTKIYLPVLQESGQESIIAFFQELTSIASQPPQTPAVYMALHKKYKSILDPSLQFEVVLTILIAAYNNAIKSVHENKSILTQASQLDFLKETQMRLNFFSCFIFSLGTKNSANQMQASELYRQFIITYMNEISCTIEMIGGGLYAQYYTDKHEYLASYFERTTTVHYNAIDHLLKPILQPTSSSPPLAWHTSLSLRAISWNFNLMQYYAAIGNETQLQSSLNILLSLTAKFKDTAHKDAYDKLLREREGLLNEIANDEIRKIYVKISEQIKASLGKAPSEQDSTNQSSLRDILTLQITLLKEADNIDLKTIILIHKCITLLQLIESQTCSLPPEKLTSYHEILESYREIRTHLIRLLEQDKGNIMASRIKHYLDSKIPLTVPHSQKKSAPLEIKDPHPLPPPPKPVKLETPSSSIKFFKKKLKTLENQNTKLKDQASELNKNKALIESGNQLRKLQEKATALDTKYAHSTEKLTQLQNTTQTKLAEELENIKKLEQQEAELQKINQDLQQKALEHEAQQQAKRLKEESHQAHCQALKVSLKKAEAELSLCMQKVENLTNELQKFQITHPPAKLQTIKEEDDVLDLQAEIQRLSLENQQLEASYQLSETRIKQLKEQMASHSSSPTLYTPAFDSEREWVASSSPAPVMHSYQASQAPLKYEPVAYFNPQPLESKNPTLPYPSKRGD